MHSHSGSVLARRSILVDLSQMLPDVQVLLGVKGSVMRTSGDPGQGEEEEKEESSLSASLWLAVVQLHLSCMPEVSLTFRVLLYFSCSPPPFAVASNASAFVVVARQLCVDMIFVFVGWLKMILRAVCSS